jgi:hypothetical protein
MTVPNVLFPSSGSREAALRALVRATELSAFAVALYLEFAAVRAEELRGF